MLLSYYEKLPLQLKLSCLEILFNTHIGRSMVLLIDILPLPHQPGIPHDFQFRAQAQGKIIGIIGIG